MSGEIIHETRVKGEEVSEFIKNSLIPVVAGKDFRLVVAGFLMVIVDSMRSDLSDEEVVEVIRDVTGYMVTRVSSIRDTSVVN